LALGGEGGKFRKIMVKVLFLLVAFLALPGTALAYVDPGTGSNIVQIIIGSIFAIGLGISSMKNYLREKVGSLVGNRKK
jgi:hypothetical protein